MYQNFYRLKEKPFSLTPDSQLVFPSKSHTAAMEYLRYGIQEKKGFILITGDAGTGKTTLCRVFLKTMQENLEVALILNSFLTELELLRAINRDFGIDAKGETREQLISTLNQFLLQQKEKGKTVVVIVDESQNLSNAVLEQIRMLSNLETEKEKLLQIVLLGQPELEVTLAQPELRQLNQRITVRYHIEPLNFYETSKYIHYRLHAAADEPSPIHFTRGAVHKIYRASRGNPRNINVLCDYALLTGYAFETFTIDRGIIRKSFKELHWQHRSWLRRMQWQWQKAVAVAGSVGVFACALALGWRLAAREEPASPPLLMMADIGIPLDTTPVTIPAPEILKFSDEGSALWELARLWTEDTRRSDSVFSQNKMVLLKQMGFQQVETWADLPVLAKINFPCVLEVKFPQDKKESFILLAGLRSQEAMLMAKEGRSETWSWKELEKIWFGKAIILSSDPDGGIYNEVFVEKMRGEGVELLQKRLYALGYLQSGVTGSYDAATREAVKNFQKDLGFTSDGIASVETQLALFHLNHQEGTPFLVQADIPKKDGTVLSYEKE